MHQAELSSSVSPDSIMGDMIESGSHSFTELKERQ